MRLIDADAYQFPGDLIYEPTIDAVEVVRCRDCLNAVKMKKQLCKGLHYREDAMVCGLKGHVVLPDDYCSGGVKADTEAQDG